eukprot:2371368-Rhodomonas_salina.3
MKITSKKSESSPSASFTGSPTTPFLVPPHSTTTASGPAHASAAVGTGFRGAAVVPGVVDGYVDEELTYREDAAAEIAEHVIDIPPGHEAMSGPDMA